MANFKILARAVLELGAELISSDGIALYELVKNAFDAGSPRVVVRMVLALPYRHYRMAMDQVEGGRLNESTTLRELLEEVLSKIDSRCPGDVRTRFARILGQPTTIDAFREKLREAYSDTTWISVEDEGEGMSLEMLESVYLTIGTQHRLEQRKKSDRVLLGEKGVGRLSTMRLGDVLKVTTSMRGERNQNYLEIDWRWFSNNLGKDLTAIEIAPTRGEEKGDRNVSGTVIRIEHLNSDWSVAKLQELAETEFNKLSDPFLPDRDRYKIRLYFNEERIYPTSLERRFLDMAHARLTGTYHVPKEAPPSLTYEVKYDLHHKHDAGTIAFTDVTSITSNTGATPKTLRDLGAFEVELYWYNRGLFRKLLTDKKELAAMREFVANWGGGLMVYRDGFRVNPYGGPEDDWLQLDPIAFKRTGFKVNRSQIVGRVTIGTKDNPKLVDQTNREGLRSCPEKEALVEILRNLLTVRFHGFLNRIDKEMKAHEKYDFDELKEGIADQEKAIRRSVRALAEKYPEAKEIAVSLDELIEEFWDFLRKVEAVRESMDDELEKYVHLAGLGLMVEILIHELERATENALKAVAESRETGIPPRAPAFKMLEAELKTLEKRLRVLDPLSISGRQTKTTFDVVQLVNDVLEAHREQFKRHQIRVMVEVSPKPMPIRVKAVIGMFIQVLENLLANSAYWLKIQKTVDKNFHPAITIALDARKFEMRLTDNGPGIPLKNRERVFEAFWTSKPRGRGKGLGLYISRQLAAYHGAELTLDEDKVKNGHLKTFVLSFKGVAGE
ncbi:MAG: sensor histidine kinase [Gemmatimonadaceae bacterium]